MHGSDLVTTTKPFRTNAAPYLGYLFVDLCLLLVLAAVVGGIAWWRAGPEAEAFSVGPLLLALASSIRLLVFVWHLLGARNAPWWGDEVTVRFTPEAMVVLPALAPPREVPFKDIKRGRHTGLATVFVLPEDQWLAIPNRAFDTPEELHRVTDVLDKYRAFVEEG